MFQPVLRAAAPMLLFLATPLAAQPAPISAADMLRHINILAADDFQGRAPGTEGETRTVDYIVAQLRQRGFEPAGVDGTWFQPVPLVERTPRSSRATWTANRRPIAFDQGNIVLQGRDAHLAIANAPVVFAGHGARMADRGIDQLAGVDVRGAVVLILYDAPQVANFPSIGQRTQAMVDAGAAAVIRIVGPDTDWQTVRSGSVVPRTRAAGQAVAPMLGIMPYAAADALVRAGGGDMARLLNDQPGSSFRSVTLPVRVSLESDMAIRPFDSRNVVGRLRGTGNGGESLLLLAHWDHLGLCRPEGAGDRICNGAVDNASGIAMMIEAAGRLGQGTRPSRDVLVLATTAEEVGLVGAGWFAAHPTVPLASIVAAINMDTVAVAPAGEPVAQLGRGIPALDALVASTARSMGRRLDEAHEADVMISRQDGYALTRAGVPSIMVGGSFASMARLEAFLEGRYHAPNDQADGEIVMDGAVEDANLLVALSRRLTDPQQYQRPQRPTE
ncbi:MAG TPA: M28 family peptidase [Allosphingosinicella sp.]